MSGNRLETTGTLLVALALAAWPVAQSAIAQTLAPAAGPSAASSAKAKTPAPKTASTGTAAVAPAAQSAAQPATPVAAPALPSQPAPISIPAVAAVEAARVAKFDAAIAPVRAVVPTTADATLIKDATNAFSTNDAAKGRRSDLRSRRP
jgi:hypothetical protein